MRRKGIVIANNIYYKIGSNYILKNINITLKSGDLFVINGSNGCGKSTLIKINSKNLNSDMGSVYSNFENINYTFDNNNIVLDNKKTILENIILLEEVFNIKSLHILELIRVFEMNTKLKIKINCLSTGQRQKINIIFSILLKKNIWIFDEPTNALDKKSIYLFKYFLNLHLKEGGTAILATHININYKNKYCIYL